MLGKNVSGTITKSRLGETDAKLAKAGGTDTKA